MRTRTALTLSLVLLLAAPVAWASFGGGSKPETPASSGTSSSSDEELTPRQQAERLYGDAYDEVTKARQDVQDGKAKNAEKKFRRALDRAKQATDLDSTYVEAWNLVGYSSRKLNDYPASLDAYAHCLRLNPGYAPAREYLGEAYLELGQPAKAREQLAMLEKLGANDDAKTLRVALTAWESAHPGATPAPADSAASASSGEKR